MTNPASSPSSIRFDPAIWRKRRAASTGRSLFGTAAVDMEPVNNDAQAQQMADCARLSPGLFALPAESIAESLASRKLSPQGASSGLRLLTFYINYAAKWLSPSRRRKLEKAKKLLSDRIAREAKARADQAY
jgi:hypothetical protein